MSKYEEFLKCTFTDAEKLDIANAPARANGKRSSLEQQKKEVDTALKAQIEQEISAINRLSNQISNGYEFRSVECRIEYDSPRAGLKTIIRTDTGEEVRTDRMTDEDRQLALELAAV